MSKALRFVWGRLIWVLLPAICFIVVWCFTHVTSQKTKSYGWPLNKKDGSGQKTRKLFIKFSKKGEQYGIKR